MPDEIHESIRAKRFELVDDRERVRAMLYWGGDDAAALEFYGEEQTSRVSIGIESNGSAAICLRDGDGTIRARIASERSGERTVLTIRDSTNRVRAQIAMDENSAIGIKLTDQWGHKRATLETAADGHTSLLMFDKDMNLLSGVAGADPDKGE